MGDPAIMVQATTTKAAIKLDAGFTEASHFQQPQVLPKVFQAPPKKATRWCLCRGLFDLDGSDVLETGFYPDTWLDNKGWGRGIARVNGFNLGYYWPMVGPQMTQYIPGPVLRNGTNIVVIIEFVHGPSDAIGAMLSPPPFLPPAKAMYGHLSLPLSRVDIYCVMCQLSNWMGAGETGLKCRLNEKGIVGVHHHVIPQMLSCAKNPIPSPATDIIIPWPCMLAARASSGKCQIYNWMQTIIIHLDNDCPIFI